jgi:MFS family permease
VPTTSLPVLSRMSDRGLGPAFRRFWAGSAVSQVGDGIRITALPLLAASITQDPVAVSLVGAAVWVPWLLFGAVGGAVVDRLDRRAVMRNVQLLRLAVMAGLAAAVVGGVVTIPLLAGVALAVGTGEVLVDSALYSVIPGIVSDERLETANGRLGAAELVGNDLIGPPIGAALFAVTHWLPFVADAVSFGASGSVLGRIRGDFKASSEGSEVASIWADTLEGLRWLSRHRVLRVLAVGIGAINLGAGFWAILVLFALEELGVSGFGFGLLISATAIGGLIGSFLGARVSRLMGRSRGILWSLAIAGVCSAGIGLTSQPWVAAALILMEGLTVGVVNVIGRSLRQVLTPDRLLGRVTSGSRMVGYGMGAVGAVIAGLLADALGLRAPFVLGGVFMALIAATMGIWINERSIKEARDT